MSQKKFEPRYNENDKLLKPMFAIETGVPFDNLRQNNNENLYNCIVIDIYYKKQWHNLKHCKRQGQRKKISQIEQEDKHLEVKFQ